MYCTKEQIIDGIASYVDNEVIPKLPTAGKWVLGSAIALALQNGHDIDISSEPFKLLGIVNQEGLVDIDRLIQALKESADKYGVLQLTYPVIGTMRFTVEDIDALRRYIR